MIHIYKGKDGYYYAEVKAIDVIDYGTTFEDAKANLKSHLDMLFEDMIDRAVLDENYEEE